jgi:hypothetical protein
MRFCVLLLSLCLLSDHAQATVRVFMAKEGQQVCSATTGNTVVRMSPGSQQVVHIWLQDLSGGQDLNTYQVVIDWFGTQQFNGTGLINYVDDGVSGGNSATVDVSRPDYAFFGEITDPVVGESVGVQFGATATLPAPTDGMSVYGVNYLGEFTLQTSPDACGRHEFTFLNPDTGGASGTVLHAPGQVPFVVTEYQALTVDLDPVNDRCNSATDIEGVGAIQLDDRCATPHGPPGCSGGANDVWFTYTATCNGEFVAELSSVTGSIAVYESSCPGFNDTHLACATTATAVPDVTIGDVLFLQVSGVGDLATLSYGCISSCTPGGSLGQIAQECCDNGNCGQCVTVGCDDRGECTFDPTLGQPCQHDSPCIVNELCGAEINACIGTDIHPDCTAVTRLFMAVDGHQAAAALTGNTAIYMPPGSQQVVHIWLEDRGSGQELNAFQAIIRWFGDPQVGASGQVNYVDDGIPGGNSGFIDEFRPDYILSGLGSPTFFNETVSQNGFGPLGSIAGFGGVQLDGFKYVGEFTLESSLGACGQHEFDFVPSGQAPAGGVSFVVPGGLGQYIIDEIQALTVNVGPPNDDCEEAKEIEGVGSIQVDDGCASADGVPGCSGGDPDVWFRYTADCDGFFSAGLASSSGAIALYDVPCMPDYSSQIDCGSTVNAIVQSGDVLLLQVSGTNGPDVLEFDCAPSCTPGAPAAQSVQECCPDGDCGQCVIVGCNSFTQCTFSSAPGADCDDGDVCTLTDTCGAVVGACIGTDFNDCNDFDPCTFDTCHTLHGGDGCLNESIADAPCTYDTQCQVAGAPGTCNGATGLCECQGSDNLNPINSLCFDIRGAGGVVQGTCTGPDADCGAVPDGILQCSDDNANPLDGGICVDQACYFSDEPVVIDVELGPTNEPVCGAQLFVGWEDCMSLLGVEIDPDGELGWAQVFVNAPAPDANAWDVVLGIPIGSACNAQNGATSGGSIARFTFDSTSRCKCGGMFLRDHNPVSGVGGADGPIVTTACNGDTPVPGVDEDTKADNDGSQYSPTDEIQVQDAPELTCSGHDIGQADCGGITRTIDVDPVSLSDDCDDLSAIGSSDICTVSYHAACQDDLDCGIAKDMGGSPILCANDAECAGVGNGTCIEDEAVDGFVCAGNLPCEGFCSVDTCTDGFCDSGSMLGDEEADTILNGGTLVLLPGAAAVHCEYTNGCGRTAECDYTLGNDGLNKLVVDVELSPTMVAGTPVNPITRCIHFELSVCGAANPETIALDADVIFGAPTHIPGHGQACIKIPAGNWDCLTAADAKHTLSSTCTAECTEDNHLYAEFKGSKATHETCHWLVQGNLNYPSPNIDIFDYAVLAGHYLTLAPNGNDSPCGSADVDADFNGDGLVTLADFSFVVANFFCESKNPCEVLCNPGGDLATAAIETSTAPRSAVTVDELYDRGLGDYAAAADVNTDGVVDLADVAGFIAANADEDPDLAAELAAKAITVIKSHRRRGRLDRVGARR